MGLGAAPARLVIRYKLNCPSCLFYCWPSKNLRCAVLKGICGCFGFCAIARSAFYNLITCCDEVSQRYTVFVFTKAVCDVWNLNLVLTIFMCTPFEPIHNFPLCLLTLKIVFLIAITSVWRVSELQALTVQCHFFPDKLVLRRKVAFLPKVVTPFSLFDISPFRPSLPCLTPPKMERRDSIVCILQEPSVSTSG